MGNILNEFKKSLKDVFQVITSDDNSLISHEGKYFLSKNTKEREDFFKKMSTNSNKDKNSLTKPKYHYIKE